MLALRLEGMEEWKFDDVRPVGRAWGATGSTDQLQLGKLFLGLEDWLPCEQFSQNTPVTYKHFVIR